MTVVAGALSSQDFLAGSIKGNRTSKAVLPGNVVSSYSYDPVYELTKAGGPPFETVLNFRVAAPSWFSKGRRV
jgi:hypothetical protein